ncbi:MAG TPA: GNAT family N-acetyltransferase [Candidatus Limnocylindrales bacterium]|nr:GNAT family N-acetyltransferase [Candidatus Limnocylindrales bacterium]
MGRPVGAPVIVLRPYRGPQDHPAMSAAANAIDVFNGAPTVRSVADMDNYYGHLQGVDLPRDCTLVEVDGVVRAYGRVAHDDLMSGEFQVFLIVNVDPTIHDLAVEDRLLQRMLERADEVLAIVPADRTVLVKVGAKERHPGLGAAAEALGFRHSRSGAQLIRPSVDDVPELTLPDGLVIRPIAADDRVMHRRIYDAGKRAFAETYGEEAASDAEFERFIGAPTFDPTLWQVAFDGDEIAGQILNFMDEQRTDTDWIGWTEGISVQPEYRRRGLARALLAASIRRVAAAGATRTALGVDLQNPNEAATLYQSMGYQIVALDREYTIGPFPAGSRPRLVQETRA